MRRVTGRNARYNALAATANRSSPAASTSSAEIQRFRRRRETRLPGSDAAIVQPCYRKNAGAGMALPAKAGLLVKVPRGGRIGSRAAGATSPRQDDEACACETAPPGGK